MRLNRNEIKALLLITSSERVLRPLDLISSLGLERGSVSRIITNLKDKGLADRVDTGIVLAKASPAESFKRLYYAHRASPFQLLLADERIELISRMGESPKSVKELHEETGIPLKTVYYYLHDLARLGIASHHQERETLQLHLQQCLLECSQGLRLCPAGVRQSAPRSP